MSTKPPTPDKQNNDDIRDTLGAPTLLEMAQGARRIKGAEGRAQGEGGGDGRTAGGDSQIIVRETNPLADGGPAGSGNLHTSRRVQQQDGKDDGDEAKGAAEFLQKRMFGERWSSKVDDQGRQVEGRETKAKPKKQDQTPKDDSGDGGAGKASDDQPPKRTVQVTNQPRPTGLSRDDLQTIVESAVTAATKRNERDDGGARAPADQGPDLSHLSQRERRRFDVVQRLAENNKDTYGNLPTEYLDYAKKRKKYAEDYRAENGKDINWADQDHQEWEISNSPETRYRDFADDFDDERVRAMAEKIAEEKLSAANESISALRTATVEHGLKDKVIAERASSVKGFQKEFAPNAQWDLTTESGKVEAVEGDPILAPIAARWAAHLEGVTSEIIRLYESNNSIKYDGRNIYHQYLNSLIGRVTEAYDQLPMEQRKNSRGQMFVSLDEYSKIPAKERGKYWTLMRDEISAAVRQDVLMKAKAERDEEIGRLAKVAKLRGWDFDPDTFLSQVGSKTIVPDGIGTANSGGRSGADDDGSPTTTGDSKIDTQGRGKTKDNEGFASIMMNRLFGR